MRAKPLPWSRTTFWAAVSGSASFACIRTVHFIDVTVSRRRRSVTVIASFTGAATPPPLRSSFWPARVWSFWERILIPSGLLFGRRYPPHLEPGSVQARISLWSVPHDDPRHNLHTQRTHGLSVLIAPPPVCGRGTKPRGRLRVGLSPLGSRPRWPHGATSYAPASYILAQCLVQSWILLLKRETPKTVPPLWSPVPPAERPWQCWNVSGKNASKS